MIQQQIVIQRTGGGEQIISSRCACDSHRRRFDSKLPLQQRSSLALYVNQMRNFYLALITVSWPFFLFGVESQTDESVPSSICCNHHTLMRSSAGSNRSVPTHLGRGDLDVDDDGRQRRLPQLRRVVDGVGVQNHQLQRPRQLEDPLDLTLDFSWTREDAAGRQ